MQIISYLPVLANFACKMLSILAQIILGIKQGSDKRISPAEKRDTAGSKGVKNGGQLGGSS